MGEVNRRYFDELMANKKLSLRGLAQKMGLSHSQLSLAFSGMRKLQLEEAAQLSTILGEPVHRIIENAGVDVRAFTGRRVPVIGIARGDAVVETPEATERATIPGDLPDDAVAIQWRCADTPLAYLDGWLMFCREPDHRVDPAAVTRFCYAKVKNGPKVMALVKRGYCEGTYNLTGAYTKENAVLEWASPILVTKH